MYKNIFTNPTDLAEIREAARISKTILQEIKANTQIGITPRELNDLAEELCIKNKVKPAFKGVPGPKEPFDGGICIGVNDGTLHGRPFSEEPLKSGDIVKLDFGISYNGFLTDHCVTVGLGELTKDEKRLIETAKLCVDTAVKQAITGNTVGDISFALQSIADIAELEYVIPYCGHGIGKELWLDPQIPSYGKPHSGVKLQTGMLICIENQLTLGSSKVRMGEDGWTIYTVDGSKSAMFEHMVLVGKDKAEVLTRFE